MLLWPRLSGKLTLTILGIGNDLCDVARMADAIRQYGQRFLDRTFTQAEQAIAGRRPDPQLFYAGRFAAKEAFVKALGTGIIEQIQWTDIEILVAPSGQPVAMISGAALKELQRLKERGSDAAIHISIARNARIAIAFVILEARYRPDCT